MRIVANGSDLDADVVHGSQFSGKLFMVGVPIKVKITGSSELDDYFDDSATTETEFGRRDSRGWRVSDKSWSVEVYQMVLIFSLTGIK